eukprot:tig00020603_g11812.t1
MACPAGLLCRQDAASGACSCEPPFREACRAGAAPRCDGPATEASCPDRGGLGGEWELRDCAAGERCLAGAPHSPAGCVANTTAAACPEGEAWAVRGTFVEPSGIAGASACAFDDGDAQVAVVAFGFHDAPVASVRVLEAGSWRCPARAA